MMNNVVLAVIHQYFHIDTKIRAMIFNLCHFTGQWMLRNLFKHYSEVFLDEIII